MLISKELNLTHPLPSGNYPVIIRVSHLGKDKIVDTFVCCHRKNWDFSKRVISRRDVAHSIKNDHIEGIFRKIAGNIQNYLDKQLEENLEELLNIYKEEKESCNTLSGTITGQTNEETSTAIASPTFSALTQEKISTITSLNTRRGYEGFLRYFQKNIDSDPSTDTISNEFVESFRNSLEKSFPPLSSMRHLLAAKFNAILSFGKEKGYVTKNLTYSLPSYSFNPSERNLTSNELSELYHKMNDRLANDPALTHPETLALSLFILDIAFQGLAPTDLAALKVGDISFSKLSPTVKNKRLHNADEAENEAVCIKTFRHKTGRPVNIIAPAAEIKHILLPLMRGKSKDDYLIPCFSKDRIYSPEQRQSRLANFFRRMSVALNKEVRRGSANETLPNITFYYARHAFCNIADSLDLPRHIIQHLIGHRSTVLERSYLRRLTSYEQLQITRQIFHQIKSSSSSSSHQSH